MKTEKTACILCSRNCGLTVEIDNGQFKKIRGDDDHPVSKGYICQKAARLTHYQQHDDRLQFPLQRQPDGSFKRVSWDEALDDIAARLLAIRDQHGGYGGERHDGGEPARGGLWVLQQHRLYDQRFGRQSVDGSAGVRHRCPASAVLLQRQSGHQQHAHVPGHGGGLPVHSGVGIFRGQREL